jgi:hypothetical protein
MQKTSLILSFLLTTAYAADFPLSEIAQSNPLSIRGKDIVSVESDQTNSLAKTQVSTFSTQIGKCTSTTYESDNIDDILQRCRNLDDTNVLIHHSIFLNGIIKKLPEKSTGLILDYLHQIITSKLTELGIDTKEFLSLPTLDTETLSYTRVVIVTALPKFEASELVEDTIQNIKKTNLDGKILIFANIPQLLELKVSSGKISKKNKGSISPERLSQSMGSIPKPKQKSVDGIFYTDWED